MSPSEMRRKGSWAVRFYGRAGKLPALKGKDGSPTRFALTAAAWGEPVPKTAAAAFTTIIVEFSFRYRQPASPPA